MKLHIASAVALTALVVGLGAPGLMMLSRLWRACI